MNKKDIADEIIKKIPSKVINEIIKKIPKKKFTDLFKITVKNLMCGILTCNTEFMNLDKIKNEKDIKLDKLTKKFKDKKITKEKYEVETQKIYSKYFNSEEHFKFIECSLNNCVEFMKKQLLLIIDIKIIKIKDNKELLTKLKAYKKLFNQPTINMKDIRKFYKEFM